MYQNNRNDFGCPLINQRGPEGVRDFQAIIAQLSPPLRAAFELERDMRTHELERIRLAGAELAPARGRSASARPALMAMRSLPELWQLHSRAAQRDMSRRIASCLPRPAAQRLRHRGAQVTFHVRDTLLRAIAGMTSARYRDQQVGRPTPNTNATQVGLVFSDLGVRCGAILLDSAIRLMNAHQPHDCGRPRAAQLKHVRAALGNKSALA